MKADNRPNSGVFIDLFTEIEQKLKEIRGDTYHSNFSEFLRNLVFHQYTNDLRNTIIRKAIIHTRSKNSIIAKPLNDELIEIRHIGNLLYNPPKVSKLIKGSPFFSSLKTPIIEMLEFIASKGFIRCPVIDE
jgi:hypothetical protein